MSSSTQSVTELVLGGEVTVTVLAELRVQFLAAIDGQGPIQVRTHDVTYLDAAALQFLWALRRECSVRARPIWIQPPSAEVLRDAQQLGMQDVFFNPSATVSR